LRPERPDKAAEAALELLRWKMTPAAAIIVSAARYPDEPAIIDERGMLTFRRGAAADERARPRDGRGGDRRR
jgi:fatty-acyl-CoA synthase